MEKISETKQIIESNAKDAPVKDILWNAQEMQTEGVRIIDPGVGREVVVRHFFFKSIPLPKGVPKPTKRELISYYKRLIEMSLWSDGLIVREDKPLELVELHTAHKISPTLYRKMKIEEADFVILVLASSRLGQVFADKPQIIQ